MAFYPAHKDFKGMVLLMHSEDWWADYEVLIKDFVERSDRQMGLDLVEPGGTSVTVSLKSQDGENFEGPYQKKDQEPNGVVRVKKRSKEDGTITLRGTWEKASGEEWWWVGQIEAD